MGRSLPTLIPQVARILEPHYFLSSSEFSLFP